MNDTTKLVLNWAGRVISGCLAGQFLGTVGLNAVDREPKILNKITIGSGCLISAWLLGRAIDDVFNKLPPFNEEEQTKLVFEDEQLVLNEK